jgi:hypothetical protein
MPAIPAEKLAPEGAEITMKLLLMATAQDDYRAIIQTGTKHFQSGITPSMFHRVSQQLAPRLQAGHFLEYLDEIRQGEFRVFLWKLSFSDGGDEYIARLALTADGKVAGCLIN